MCGIVGYVGKQQALGIALEALRRMEYRGYDSSGIAVLGNDRLNVAKRAGKLQNLEDKIAEMGPGAMAGTTAIGHTRWATHGRPTDENAHPHVSFDGKAAIVHNGIIENFAPLREQLERDGVQMVSDTDSEVAAHLLAKAYKEGETAGDFKAASLSVLNRLEGAFTVLFTHADHPDTIIAARRSTPLIVGVGDGEMFLGSDVAAFIEYTKDAVELESDSVVVMTKDSYEVLNFDGTPSEGKPFTIDWDLEAAEKGGFDSFMMKEIYEQPAAVRDLSLIHISEPTRLL